MKIAVLSAFPLLDSHLYKKIFLEGLLQKEFVKASDVVLIHERTRPSDYLREAAKFGWGETFEKILYRRHQVKSVSPRRPSVTVAGPRLVRSFAAEHGIRTLSFDRLGAPSCVKFLTDFSPDLIHNMAGQYVPPRILSLPRLGVVSGHYGLLPDLRGSDVVRWAVYLDKPIIVSHMFLAPQMDRGDVIRSQPIAVEPGDSVRDIYWKCQLENARGHLAILDDVAAGRLERAPQAEKAGCLYFRMGRYLRAKVDKKLTERSYPHYV